MEQESEVEAEWKRNAVSRGRGVQGCKQPPAWLEEECKGASNSCIEPRRRYIVALRGRPEYLHVSTTAAS
jgi:hypothetical protein